MIPMRYPKNANVFRITKYGSVCVCFQTFV